MPLKRRRKSNTGIYHVIAKGINKEHIFNQIRERVYFQKLLRKFLEKYEVKLYAYCIMSNHIHLVLQAELQILSMFMSQVLAEYALYYNYKHQRNGHVFQNRFKSECIENSRYFWNCIRYVHLNPVKACMSKDIYSYRFSSVQEYITEKRDLIHKKALENYHNCFEEIKTFQTFHQENDNGIYLDIAAEVEKQLFDAALTVLFTMAEELRVKKVVEILEDKEYRNDYVKRLKEFFGISEKKTDKLYKQIKDSIMIK